MKFRHALFTSLILACSSPAFANQEVLAPADHIPQLEGFGRSPAIQAATQAAINSGEHCLRYIKTYHSATAHRLYMHGERLLNEIYNFANGTHGGTLRQQLYFIQRSDFKLFKHWRRYEAMLDAHANALYRQWQYDIAYLDSIVK